MPAGLASAGISAPASAVWRGFAMGVAVPCVLVSIVFPAFASKLTTLFSDELRQLIANTNQGFQAVLEDEDSFHCQPMQGVVVLKLRCDGARLLKSDKSSFYFFDHSDTRALVHQVVGTVWRRVKRVSASLCGSSRSKVI